MLHFQSLTRFSATENPPGITLTQKTVTASTTVLINRITYWKHCPAGLYFNPLLSSSSISATLKSTAAHSRPFWWQFMSVFQAATSFIATSRFTEMFEATTSISKVLGLAIAQSTWTRLRRRVLCLWSWSFSICVGRPFYWSILWIRFMADGSSFGRLTWHTAFWPQLAVLWISPMIYGVLNSLGNFQKEYLEFLRCRCCRKACLNMFSF